MVMMGFEIKANSSPGTFKLCFDPTDANLSALKLGHCMLAENPMMQDQQVRVAYLASNAAFKKAAATAKAAASSAAAPASSAAALASSAAAPSPASSAAAAAPVAAAPAVAAQNTRRRRSCQVQCTHMAMSCNRCNGWVGRAVAQRVSEFWGEPVAKEKYGDGWDVECITGRVCSFKQGSGSEESLDRWLVQWSDGDTREWNRVAILQGIDLSTEGRQPQGPSEREPSVPHCRVGSRAATRAMCEQLESEARDGFEWRHPSHSERRKAAGLSCVQ